MVAIKNDNDPELAPHNRFFVALGWCKDVKTGPEHHNSFIHSLLLFTQDNALLTFI